MPETLAAVIEAMAHERGVRPALRFEGADISFADLHANASRVANGLRLLGLGKGDRFAILELNTPPVLELVLGAALLGAVPVLLNWRLAPVEMDFILTDAGVEHLFWGSAFAPVVDALDGAGLTHKLGLDGDYRSWRDAEAPDFTSPDPIVPDDVLVQLYTSGTTGLPKGVQTTHRNMLTFLRGPLTALPGIDIDSRHQVCAPMFHIAGLGYSFCGLVTGGTSILHSVFDPSAVADAIATEGVTHTVLVPAMQQAILALPDLADRDFSSLTVVGYGASPMSPDLLTRSMQTFGCDFVQFYGLTETTATGTVLGTEDHRRGADPDATESDRTRLAAAGRAAPGAEVRIVAADSSLCGPDEPGEVCIRGEAVTPGYWNRPEANTEAFDDEGWFHTGDVARMDADGYVYIIDRLKDMIVSKAENVYPAEVEHVLAEHPDIADVTVIGVPDEEYGEAVCAVVVPAGDTCPSADSLREWARDKLASYKLPRRVEVVEELPRNPSGKVLRREVRAPFWAGRERQVN